MIRGRLPKVFIAPAAFYKEYPQFGGDGLIVRDAADKLGMECGTIPTRSTGGLDVNAEIIGRTLADQDGDGFILVTLSKGGADARIAFEQGHIPQGKVAAWLQIGGLIHGTPLATHLLQGGWWRRALLTGYLAYTSASRELVSDLVSGEGSRLSRRAMAPDGVTVINMVGFPLARHLSGNLRSRHSRLAEFGPNDGCTLIRDAIVEPGLVLPIWGANHYFQHPVMPRCALALLKYLRIRLSADNSSGSSFNPPIHPRRECEA
ncbi:hypothetical protein HY256_09450 [Candidatus Sumerlaeota bacterium]|nr:hypothetical protein [Candidatus Sumerlaeota bacterium]